MRISISIFVFIFFISCSFDNKSGIWKNDSIIKTENNTNFSQFEDLITVNSPFKEELKIEDDFEFDVPKMYSNLEWTDIFYNQNNNSINFQFSDQNKKSFRSKKISKHKVNDFILYENNRP